MDPTLEQILRRLFELSQAYDVLSTKVVELQTEITLLEAKEAQHAVPEAVL